MLHISFIFIFFSLLLLLNFSLWHINFDVSHFRPITSTVRYRKKYTNFEELK